MSQELKTIAMYLPQFHRVAENEEWWGEGFTDWTSMKDAQPLFEGHRQPKKPLNDNRYDLLKKETMEWQANLMEEYGIDGMCFYHYWFGEGRRILEKPAENLLQWQDIRMPFCFCWANESWIRSWSKYTDGNVWTSVNETNIGDEEGYLLKQDYGNEKAWEGHFEYLLPFFRDGRYIKIGNKPVFVIYKIDEIGCIDQMLECWNNLATLHGFDGIYIIGFNYSKQKIERMDAELVHEPVTSFKEFYTNRFSNPMNMQIARYIPYEEIWKHTLERKNYAKKAFLSGFSRYDSTPRKGKFGNVVYNETPEKFKIFLTELFAKSKAMGNELVFINAWNEWGEGMYLEPDESDGYEYLKAISYAKEHYLSEMYKYDSQYSNEIDAEALRMNQIMRYKNEALIMNAMMDYMYHPEKLNALTEKYHKIAIYGMGMVGKRLAQLLTSVKGLQVIGIDRNYEGLNIDIKVCSPDEKLEQCDVVVVSLTHLLDEICDSIGKNVNCPIVSIKDFFGM